jgi:hypothetical protein
MMKLRPICILAALGAVVVIPLCFAADVPFGTNTIVQFASLDEGRKILMTKDEFVRALSPFDRSARMKVDRPLTEDEYLGFVGNNVAEWTAEERQAVEAALKEIHLRLREWPLGFPEKIHMVKTSGAEEGHATYTRGSAIMIPARQLAKGDSKELARLICHELFHILSRQNPELREKLYGVIGFIPCDNLEFPRELAARKITNPDAPRNDHFIRIEIDGRKCSAIPVLLSRAETYDAARGGEFFEYLEFQFLVVELDAGKKRPKVVYENGAAKLAGPPAVSGFLEQVGRNTKYVIHPEEILADNFALLVLEDQGVQSPEIIQKMKTILGQKPKG